MNEIQRVEKSHASGLQANVTLGNFDGLHLGHREFLSHIKEDCLNTKVQFVLVTFIPHPLKILKPESAPFLINSYDERRTLLDEIGVDYLVEIPFTKEFSILGPENFLNSYLFHQGIDIRKIFLGYDFSFGAQRKGDEHFLRNYLQNEMP